MKKYIGTKLINAKPMTRKEYNNFRGWELPSDEDGSDEGYLVEYHDSTNANTPEYKGYVAWSPKLEFERAYRETDDGCMPFGLALEAVKKGHKVARKGWNGKGIFIALHIPDDHEKMSQPFIYIDTTGLVSNNEYAPKALVPWLASQTDMLADDWEIVE